jgi:hypothetical protein
MLGGSADDEHVSLLRTAAKKSSCGRGRSGIRGIKLLESSGYRETSFPGRIGLAIASVLVLKTENGVRLDTREHAALAPISATVTHGGIPVL